MSCFKAKICGITRLHDALYAVEQGAWALGFNFYSASPRHVSILQAKDIIRQLPAQVLKIGVFVNEQPQQISSIMDHCGLDFAQVYAPLELPLQQTQRMILALNEAPQDEALLQRYAYVLLDAPRTQDGLYGGTGRLAAWELAADLAQRHRLILAGGLTPEHVAQALSKVQPYALDVASGVEESAGIKSDELVKEFIGAQV